MPTTPAHTALEGRPERARGGRRANLSRRAAHQKTKRLVRTGFGMDTGNDPSAGSPTETLLRLLLPLNNLVCKFFALLLSFKITSLYPI